MNPSLLLDISQIPRKLAGLAGVTSAIAVAMLGFMIPYSILELNIQGLKSRQLPDYSSLFVRCLVVMLALLCYQRLFYFIVRVSQIMSFAVLSEEQWGTFLLQSFHGAADGAPTLNVLLHPINTMQETMLWLSSLVAVIARDVVVLLQGCFLSLLFAFGPIAVACGVSERTIQVTRGWIANSFQVAFWTFFLRLAVRVWLTLSPFAANSGMGVANDYLGILTVNVSFLLMVLGTPILTARMLSGESLAAFGEAALAGVQTVMVARKLGAGFALSREVDKYKRDKPEYQSSFFHHPIPATKTALKRELFPERETAPRQQTKPALESPSR